MDLIRQLALTKALTFLNASGCEYAVRQPDGTVHGTLTITPPQPEKKVVTRVKVNDFNTIIPGGYTFKVNKLAVGEEVSFTLPRASGMSDVDFKRQCHSFHSALNSSCRRRWGVDTYVLQFSYPDFQVLRVA